MLKQTNLKTKNQFTKRRLLTWFKNTKNKFPNMSLKIRSSLFKFKNWLNNQKGMNENTERQPKWEINIFKKIKLCRSKLKAISKWKANSKKKCFKWKSIIFLLIPIQILSNTKREFENMNRMSRHFEIKFYRFVKLNLIWMKITRCQKLKFKG